MGPAAKPMDLFGGFFRLLLIPVLSLYSPDWAGYILITLVILSAITTFQALFTTLYVAEKER